MKSLSIPTITLSLVLGLPLCASAQMTAERVFSATEYVPGAPVQVEINVAGEPGPVTVVEMPPSGWAVENIATPGRLDGGLITWDLTDFTGSKRIRYRVFPPSTAMGSVFFWGRVGDQDISGMSTLLAAVPKPIGIFQNHLDMGNLIPPGDAVYDSRTGEYRISTGGVKNDATYHLMYLGLSGDFTLKAKVRVEDRGGSLQEWAAAGLVVRDTLETDPGEERMPYFSTWFTISGRVGARWKNTRDTRPVDDFALIFPKEDGGVQEIVREGPIVSMYYIDSAKGGWVLYTSQEIELTDPVYLGLWASSFQAGGVTVAYFSDVEFVPEAVKPPTSAVEDWHLYR